MGTRLAKPCFVRRPSAAQPALGLIVAAALGCGAPSLRPAAGLAPPPALEPGLGHGLGPAHSAASLRFGTAIAYVAVRGANARGEGHLASGELTELVAASLGSHPDLTTDAAEARRRNLPGFVLDAAWQCQSERARARLRVSCALGFTLSHPDGRILSAWQRHARVDSGGRDEPHALARVALTEALVGTPTVVASTLARLADGAVDVVGERSAGASAPLATRSR
jgi:hypothetical protein